MRQAAEAHEIAAKLRATGSVDEIASIIDGLDDATAKRVLRIFVYAEPRQEGEQS